MCVCVNWFLEWEEQLQFRQYTEPGPKGQLQFRQTVHRARPQRTADGSVIQGGNLLTHSAASKKGNCVETIFRTNGSKSKFKKYPNFIAWQWKTNLKRMKTYLLCVEPIQANSLLRTRFHFCSEGTGHTKHVHKQRCTLMKTTLAEMYTYENYSLAEMYAYENYTSRDVRLLKLH